MSEYPTIDPTTKRELDMAVHESFNELIDQAEEMGGLDYDDPQQLAEDFFYYGFVRGCVAMTDDEDLKETIYMMQKEYEYQMKNR